MCFRPGDQTPQLAESQWDIAPDVDHMEEEVQLKVQVEEERIGKNTERNKVRNRESKNGQTHNVDDHADEMTRTNIFLSHAV